MYSAIQQVISLMDYSSIPNTRKTELQILVNAIQNQLDKASSASLHFICTHNSRRSQFSQVWAQVAASYFKIPVVSFSGGVEVTACHPHTIESLQRFGFDIHSEDSDNPKHQVRFASDTPAITLYSKLFDAEENPTSRFIAIMTCSDADENCPVITGCDQRISLRYNDPKIYDESPLETAMYDYRSFQIATELMYVFSNIQLT